mmetsp:Transcript_15096/g.22212  ORF Transcript_15096/g.22212 Transcript_15096/m.22212 type:complete len:158 (-) Transcript_15096:1323-1796(-)
MLTLTGFAMCEDCLERAVTWFWNSATVQNWRCGLFQSSRKSMITSCPRLTRIHAKGVGSVRARNRKVFLGIFDSSRADPDLLYRRDSCKINFHLKTKGLGNKRKKNTPGMSRTEAWFKMDSASTTVNLTTITIGLGLVAILHPLRSFQSLNSVELVI